MRRSLRLVLMLTLAAVLALGAVGSASAGAKVLDAELAGIPQSLTSQTLSGVVAAARRGSSTTAA